MKTLVGGDHLAVYGTLLLAVMLASQLSAVAVTSAHTSLDQRQVDGLVRGGVASQRICALVKKRGISFRATPGFLRALQEDGADHTLLDTLRHLAPEVPSAEQDTGTHWREAMDRRAQGKRLFDKGQYALAVAELQRAARLDAVDPATHFYLARAFAAEGKLGKAVSEYRQTILLSPDTTPARFNLGNLLLRQGDWDGAATQFREALGVSPDDASAHYGLGVALYHQGNLPAAISEFRQSIALIPSKQHVHIALGLALQAQNNVNGAIDEYRKALALNPRDAMAHADLASALVRKGLEREAASELRAAIKLAPEDVSYHASYDELLKQTAH